MQGTQNALSGAQLLKSKTSEKIKAPMRRRTQLGFGVGGKIEVTGVDVCRGSKHGGGSRLESGSHEQAKFVLDP